MNDIEEKVFGNSDLRLHILDRSSVRRLLRINSES